MADNNDPLGAEQATKDARECVRIAVRYTADDEQVLRGVMNILGGKFNPETVRKMIDEERANR